jgi:hypothetical protein
MDILTAKYSTFADTSARGCQQKKCHPKGCGPLLHALSDKKVVRDRAKRIEHVYITSTMIDQVIAYIAAFDYDTSEVEAVFPFPQDIMNQIMEEKLFCEIIDANEMRASHIRYIKEMTIEFNMIEDRDEFLEMYNQGSSLGSILEILKERFHSTWRNEKDFAWIAKEEPDYDKEYAAID